MIEISCENVSVAYDEVVVRQVSFTVDKGDFVSIVGENGSGKTTLIKAILGLHPVSSGKIYRASSRNIGYVPQQTPAQKDFPASVYEVVLSGCLSSKGVISFYNKKDKALADSKIREMGIEHIKNKCYRELSGGQQQRALLARALCAAQNILVLDEPVSGLDPVATEELYSLLKNLNKSKGMTILMVSHDIEAALKTGNKILHMDKELKFYGTVEEYVESDCAKRFLS